MKWAVCYVRHSAIQWWRLGQACWMLLSADNHLSFHYYPVPGRGTGYCNRAISFFLSLFIYLFLCQQHYKKTAGPICMKFSGKVWSDHGTTWFNFGSVRVNGSVGWRSGCLLSPAIAQTTGVNKSVAYVAAEGGVCCAPHHSFIMRPSYRPHCICYRSVCPYMLVTQKQKM